MNLLWAEHKFNSGIIGLLTAERKSKTMLVLVARVRQQAMKTLKQWRKWFWLIVDDDVKISFGSYQAILTDVLGMKRAVAKIVSKLLNFEKKQRRMDIVQEMLTTFNDPGLLKKVITGDESWVYGYDIETKGQSCQ